MSDLVVRRLEVTSTDYEGRGASVWVGTGSDRDSGPLPLLSDLPPDLASALRRWLGPEPADSS